MPMMGLFEDRKKVRTLLTTTTSLCSRSIAGAMIVASSLLCLPQISLAQEVDLANDSQFAEPSLTQPLAPSSTTIVEIGGPESLPPLPTIPKMLDDDDPVFASQPTEPLTIADLLGLASFSGVLLFALIAGTSLVRTRRDSNKKLRQAHQALRILQTRLDRSESLLNASDQLMIVWDDPSASPAITGSLADDGRLPQEDAILAFGSWLSFECAQKVEMAINKLRASGQPFVMTAQSHMGHIVEIRGRPSGARVLLRMRILEGEEHDRAQLHHEAGRLSRELTRLKGLLDQVPMPVWARDEDGQLSWINEAYRKAVESESLAAVLEVQSELLDQRGRETIAKGHDADQIGKASAAMDIAIERLPVIVAGKRRIYDVIDIATNHGTVGIATDVSEMDLAEKALERTQAFHANVMDQLTTPVAFFDSQQNLQFYNAAYSALFQLEPSFLDQNPSDSALLDKLRSNRRLPEQADFHSWKQDFLSIYQAVETREYWWHLPDGQSLRVVASPNPDGGVIYLFENVTEQLDLEKRYNSLIRVQTETLDHLNDGVVVFGSDGRVRVSNPAFAILWDIDPNLLEGQPHVGAVLEICRRKFSDQKIWSDLKASITGLADKREGVAGRMECKDERILDFASIPLPDGATMVTFVDVTDNVTVERGLVDRNEALMAADQLKNTFIQHVSYELRSPLTNIIGFTELLTSEAFGILNDKQRDYTDHIMTSSSSLLAIVNDILDLATLDAGIMELELAEVDPVNSIRAAAEGLQDRLAEKNVSLDISVAEDMGRFIGDPHRVRQVLYNLISNAIEFSDKGSQVSVIADRDSQAVSFAVKDHGCGMSGDFVETAFERFEARNGGSARKGAGLGLSIVKSFVELHGGTVDIRSIEGQGTTIFCHFPIEPKPISQAAE